jgi:hypothetical protein
MNDPCDDTSPEAREYLIKRLREMSVAEKFMRMTKLCGFARRLTISGILSDYPGIGEEELRYHFAFRTLGQEIADKYFKVKR